MKTIFISDVHLRDPADENYRRMDAFLAALLTDDVERLVINGDFFDAWFGENQAAEELYAPILRRLANVRCSGIPIVFLEGNHDFVLENVLSRWGIEVIAGEWRTELYGSRVLTTHGDFITGDKWHRRYRAGMRSPVIAGLNAIVPDAWSLKLAFGMSGASRQRTPDVAEIIREKIRAHGRTLADVDVFITGHTHLPMDECVDGPHGLVRVINLGDWVTNFTYLEASEAGWELRYA